MADHYAPLQLLYEQRHQLAVPSTDTARQTLAPLQWAIEPPLQSSSLTGLHINHSLVTRLLSLASAHSLVVAAGDVPLGRHRSDAPQAANLLPIRIEWRQQDTPDSTIRHLAIVAARQSIEGAVESAQAWSTGKRPSTAWATVMNRVTFDGLIWAAHERTPYERTGTHKRRLLQRIRMRTPNALITDHLPTE